MLFLSADDVQALLDLDELRDSVRSALHLLSTGRASVPPRVAAVTPNGLVGVMPGYVEDAAVAVKVVTVFRDNHARAIPSHQAIIAVVDPDTGTPLALMDGTYITAVRTAATSAVAADVLAAPTASVLAILGAGVQGQAHLDALCRVRRFEHIIIASRDRASAEQLVGDDPRAVATNSFEDAVRDADVVCCCTDAGEPIVQRDWLSAGAHVGSVGSGTEVDAGTVATAGVFVEWRGAASNPPPAGAAELQHLDPDAVTEIGEVLAGIRPGRRGGEITLFKSTGHAVEDVAAADLVYRRAQATKVGATLVL
jgi:ornithine cyclodeaminase/alanine dehydrogenase-like protein (mu-crystallin family)